MTLEDFLTKEIKNISFKAVKPNESLIKSGLLSSITVVDLVVSIEEAYGVKIPFNDINQSNFDTIEMIVNFLHQKGVSKE